MKQQSGERTAFHDRELPYIPKKQHGKLKNAIRRFFYRWIIKKYLTDCRTVMDIGAGFGAFYDMAKSMGKEVQGVDLDSQYIRDKIVKMDYRDIKGEYDCCFSSQFIEHVNQFGFMKVMQRCCKKVLIVITPRPGKRFWDSPNHIRPYTKKAISRLYQGYGFKTVFMANLYPTRSFIVIGRKDGT